MPMKSPTVRHRRLGRELRRLRETANLSVDAAAIHLGWSQSKVNRIENARIMISSTDIANACDLYGADSPTKASLIQLAKDASQRGWWTAYSDVFTGSFVGLEAEASDIYIWQPLLIPGLLQTDKYAHELFRVGRPDFSDSDIDRHVSARMARKIVLGTPPIIRVVIDETVLRPVERPKIMAEQIEALLGFAARDTITIQVLPHRAGLHRGLEGAFSVMSFSEPTDPDVGYVESPAGDIYVEAPDQVRLLKLMFERLAGSALSPEESAAFLSSARSNHV
ncbi:helix-turn-helix transcriptional regulator [Streptosporangium oxazolinicum]|uniref:Helix-turn-helix transcriptional regulator n=2 Tax=Streptosporangium oxazolinicum TaxID=909287 RepID=A0ABP8B309_9ACTN